VLSKLDSQLESRGFKSYPLLDGNGVKAMLGSIPASNPGRNKNFKKFGNMTKSNSLNKLKLQISTLNK